MDMKSFMVDDYFTEYESKAKYMMGSSDPETLFFKNCSADIHKYNENTLSYSLGNGYLPLREKISSLYENVCADNIAVMNGGEEVIYVTMRALLNAGDEIVVQMPSYQSLHVIAKEIGCRIIDFRPSFEQKWEFDIDMLKSKVCEKTKAIVLNYPHNPTGACLTYAEMEDISSFCRERGIILIADEMYRFLRIDDNCTDASFADVYENAVVFGGFSKTFASPGLRIGWAAAKNEELMKKMLAYRHFTSTCTNLPCQWIANELLYKKEEIINRNISIIKKNAGILKQFIKKHPDIFSYVPPKGASTAYVKLLGGRKAMNFCMEILDNTGVLIVPSAVLDDSDEYLRIGICKESFAQCAELLDEYLILKKI